MRELQRYRLHEEPTRVLCDARICADILEAAIRDDDSLRDTKHLLRRMIQKMELVPLSNIFDLIGDEDTVEIYTVDN